jgi:type IV fimbrial biogenesis protein FimT
MVELMFAVAILAILLSIGIPSFRDASLGGKLRAIASSLHASVMLARSEAIKSNETTTLCASADGSTCAGSGGWEQGWVVLDADDNVLEWHQPVATGFKVTQSGGTASLTFRPIGVGHSAATFTVCREAPLGKQERIVSVTATGVAHVTMTETGSCP